MIKQVFLLLTIFIGLAINTWSQDRYDNGYFIDKTGNKVVCKIKRAYGVNTPQSFVYKLGKSDKKHTLKKEELREVGVENHSKFIKRHVIFQTASPHIGNYKPKAISDTLVLSVLVQGAYTLLVYEQGDELNFFYINADDDNKVISLDYSTKLEGNYWEQRVSYWSELKRLASECPAMDTTGYFNPARKAKRLDYASAKFVDFFQNLNSCANSKSTLYGKERKTSILSFDITIAPGVGLANTTFEKEIEYYGPPFSEKFQKASVRLGLELEAKLWQLPYVTAFTEAALIHQSRSSRDLTGGLYNIDFNLSTVNWGLGLRFRLPLSGANALWVNAVYSPYSFNLGGTANYNRIIGRSVTNYSKFDISEQNAFGLGIGGTLGRYGFELRHTLNHNINVSNEQIFKLSQSSFMLSGRIQLNRY